MSRARRTPREHFFLAAVESDASRLCGLLGALPGNAYGQLLVEDADTAELLDLPRPAGISVYGMRPDLDLLLQGYAPDRGELLAQGVRAWAAEWLPDPGSGEEPPEITMWIDGAGCREIEELCHELVAEHPGIHLHHTAHAAGDR